MVLLQNYEIFKVLRGERSSLRSVNPSTRREDSLRARGGDGNTEVVSCSTEEERQGLVMIQMRLSTRITWFTQTQTEWRVGAAAGLAGLPAWPVSSLVQSKAA